MNIYLDMPPFLGEMQSIIHTVVGYLFCDTLSRDPPHPYDCVPPLCHVAGLDLVPCPSVGDSLDGFQSFAVTSCVINNNNNNSNNSHHHHHL